MSTKEIHSENEIPSPVLKQGTDAEVPNEAPNFATMLKEMSTADLSHFLESELRLNPERSAMPQQEVETLLTEAFSRIKEPFDDGTQTLLQNLLEAVMVDVRDDYENENITDRVWLVLPGLISRYPVATTIFLEYLGQHGQMAQPEAFIGSAVEMLTLPDLPNETEHALLDVLNAQYAFHSAWITDAVMANLDFNDPSKFLKTAFFLDFIKHLHAWSEMEDLSERNMEPIEQVLSNVLVEESGSYFLWLKARDTLEEMRRWRKSDEYEKRRIILESHNDLPRVIAPELVAYYDRVDDRVYIGAFADSNLRPLFYKDLIHSNSVERTPEEQSRMVQDFSYLCRPDIRMRINQMIGCDLSQIPIPEQVRFLDWAKTQDLQGVRDINSFVDKHGVNGLRTFFTVTENRRSMILSMGKHLQPEVATVVFAKHAELLDAVYRITEYIRTTFGKEASEQVTASVERMLLAKAHELLRDYFTVAFTNSFNFSGKNLQARTVIEKHIRNAESVKADLELFKSSFKSLSESGTHLSIEDIRDAEIAQKHGGQISESDTEIMRSIYSANQSGVGAHDEILAHFDERVKNPEARFYVFKWQGKIQSFVAFEPSEKIPGALEATSFNVDPSARGYKIGEAMLEEAIAKEAQTNVLEGECYANLSISAKYIETGWVAHGTFPEPGKKEGTIDTLLNIVRDDAQNEVYWSKNGETTREQIVRRERIPHNVKIVSADKQGELPFAEYLAHGEYVLTRMFKEPSPGRRYFAVFEQAKRKPKKVSEGTPQEEPEEVGV